MRLSSVGFSELCLDFAPDPDVGVGVRPREPRNCCARFSCFFFSRESLTKLAKSAMMIEAVERDTRGEGIVRKARRESSLSSGRVNGRYGRSARFASSEGAAPGYPPLALSLKSSSCELLLQQHNRHEVSHAPYSNPAPVMRNIRVAPILHVIW